MSSTVKSVLLFYWLLCGQDSFKNVNIKKIIIVENIFYKNMSSSTTMNCHKKTNILHLNETERIYGDLYILFITCLMGL